MDDRTEEQTSNADHLDRPPVEQVIKKSVKRSKKAVKFKKAPQAPRRFKSAYMFFSTAKHPEIRARITDNGKNATKTTHVAKLVSQEWKSLGKEEREKWEELARKDKARFEMEKSTYTGPWKVPKRKGSDRDPNEPKRPMSSFLSFSNSMRSAVKKEFPHMSNAEISRVLAQRWKEAPEDVRQIHIGREKKLREEYKLAMVEYKNKQDAEIEAERLKREEVVQNYPGSNPLGEPAGHAAEIPYTAQGYQDYSAYNNYYSQNTGPEGSGHGAIPGASAYCQRDFHHGYNGGQQTHYDYSGGGYGYYPSQYAPGSYGAGYEGHGEAQHNRENAKYYHGNPSENQYESHEQHYANRGWYDQERKNPAI